MYGKTQNIEKESIAARERNREKEKVLEIQKDRYTYLNISPKSMYGKIQNERDKFRDRKRDRKIGIDTNV